MKPTLPSNFFSLCIIPQHDLPPKHANIIISNGPLCSIEKSHIHDHQKGIFDWWTQQTLQMVRQINYNSDSAYRYAER